MHGQMDVHVYVEQSLVHNDRGDCVWRPKRSLYGLKQARRAWLTVSCATLNVLQFCRSGYDLTLVFATEDGGEKQFVYMPVDDLHCVITTVLWSNCESNSARVQGQ
jgi:hypothetical protein